MPRMACLECLRLRGVAIWWEDSACRSGRRTETDFNPVSRFGSVPEDFDRPKLFDQAQFGALVPEKPESPPIVARRFHSPGDPEDSSVPSPPASGVPWPSRAQGLPAWRGCLHGLRRASPEDRPVVLRGGANHVANTKGKPVRFRQASPKSSWWGNFSGLGSAVTTLSPIRRAASRSVVPSRADASLRGNTSGWRPNCR